MEDMEGDDAARERPIPDGPIWKASTTTDEEDAKLVYDRTYFRKDKVKRWYFHYYHGCRIIIKRGATIEELDECSLRVRVVLDA